VVLFFFVIFWGGGGGGGVKKAPFEYSSSVGPSATRCDGVLWGPGEQLENTASAYEKLSRQLAALTSPAARCECSPPASRSQGPNFNESLSKAKDLVRSQSPVIRLVARSPFFSNLFIQRMFRKSNSLLRQCSCNCLRTS